MHGRWWRGSGALRLARLRSTWIRLRRFVATAGAGPLSVRAPEIRRGFDGWLGLGAYLVLGASTLSAACGTVPYRVHLVISTVAIFALSVVAHDAIHRAAARDRRWNRALGWVASIAVGVPFHVLEDSHQRHHALVDTPADPELYCQGPWWQVPLRLATVLGVYYVHAQRTLDRAGRRRAKLWLGTSATLVFAVPSLVWLWLVPALLSSFWFALLTVWLPHGPLARAVLRWAPSITGYHQDHHARSAYPVHQYHQLHEWQRARQNPTEPPLLTQRACSAVST